MSLATYIRETFKSHDLLEVVAPWMPDGATFRLRLRPHDTSEFVTARAELEIPEPMTIEARTSAETTRVAKERRKAAALAAAKSKGKRKEVADAEVNKIVNLLERQAEEPSALPSMQHWLTERWDIRYPVYTPDEVAVLTPAVGTHLVESIECENADGEVTQWSRREIDETFAETAKIPQAFPDEPDLTVEMSGYEERVAWAVVVLRAVVQEHLFLEREVPLGGDSEDSAESPDTA